MNVTTSRKKQKKKDDALIERTDKILMQRGIKPKEFDSRAILEARKDLFNQFVEKNIDDLLLIEGDEDNAN